MKIAPIVQTLSTGVTEEVVKKKEEGFQWAMRQFIRPYPSFAEFYRLYPKKMSFAHLTENMLQNFSLAKEQKARIYLSTDALRSPEDRAKLQQYFKDAGVPHRGIASVSGAISGLAALEMSRESS